MSKSNNLEAGNSAVEVTETSGAPNVSTESADILKFPEPYVEVHISFSNQGEFYKSSPPVWQT